VWFLALNILFLISLDSANYVNSVTSLPLKRLTMVGLTLQGIVYATGFVPVLFHVVVVAYFFLVFQILCIKRLVD